MAASDRRQRFEPPSSDPVGFRCTSPLVPVAGCVADPARASRVAIWVAHFSKVDPSGPEVDSDTSIRDAQTQDIVHRGTEDAPS